LAVAFLIPFNTNWAPHAHSHFRKLYIQLLQRNPLVRIEEKTFLQIGDHHIYVEKKDKRAKRLEGITIYKTPSKGAPLRIFAEHGEASMNPQKGLTLHLKQGRIEEIDPAHPDQWFHTGFQTYVLTIPFMSQQQASTRSLQEMDNQELLTQGNQLKSKGLGAALFDCQRHLRWALATTPILFVLLGIPLAIQVQRGGRSIGFGLSLAIIAVYYMLLMGGTGLGQRGVWPPWLAVWMGNMSVGVLSVFLSLRFLRI
jgi:lipopolysaccharide export LptBFGC system permease protein LptF